MSRPLFPSLTCLRVVGCLLAWLLLAGAAQAANAKFDGDPVPYCGHPAYDSGTRTYTCDPLAADVDITIASGYTLVVRGSMTFDFHQFLKMEGSAKLYVQGDLNMGNIQPAKVHVDGGKLVADGQFSMGAQAQEITADVTAGSIVIGTGSNSKVNGSLTSTGPITLAANVTVVGDVSGTVVKLLASATSVQGNITATTSLRIASGNKVTGNIDSGNLTMDASGVLVTGNVKVTGNLVMGSGDTINGSAVVSGNVTLQDSNAYISGKLTADSVLLGYAGRIGQTITCTGPPINTTTCSCVTNNSGYEINSVNGPKCTAPLASVPHHLHVEHDATALTCQPSGVKVTACVDAACSTTYTGGTTVTLNPGGLSFAIGASGVNSVATVQPPSASAVTVTAVSSVGATAATTCKTRNTGATDCRMTGTEQGLTLSVPDHLAETVQTATLQALQSGGNGQSCVPLFKNTSKDINVSCGYKNPASGTLPVRLNGNLALAAKADAACTAGGASLSLGFDDEGKATTSLIYADAGEMILNAKYSGPLSNVAGSPSGVVSGSGTFISAPARFAFTIMQAAAPAVANPAPLDPIAATPAFIKAGEKFTGVLKVVNSIGNPTPNFGKESPVATYSITQKLVLPLETAGGVNAPLIGNFAAMANGVSPAAEMRWDEVGIFSITAQLNNVNGYLGAGKSKFLTGGSVNVGRFVPSHFATKVISDAALAHLPMDCPIGMSCPASINKLIFSAQPAVLEVSAYALTGSATRNYFASPGLAYAVAVTAWGPLNTSGATEQSGAANPGGGAMVAGHNTVPAASFAAGVGKAAIQYKFAASKVAPAHVHFRASDGEASSLRTGGTSEGGIAVASGRLLVAPAYGSAQYSMPVALRAQYWSGAAYLNSTLQTDPLSLALWPQLDKNALGFGNCRKGLLKADGSCVEIAPAAPVTALAFTDGKATFRLAKPGLSGSTELGVSAVPYLPPAPGMLTFGIYNAGPVIYLREVY